MLTPSIGMPKIGTVRLARNRIVSADAKYEFKTGGGVIDGTKTRDIWNPDVATEAAAINDVRPGLLMGKVTATDEYANTFFGELQGAIAGAATSFTLLAGQAAELVRRVGATGTVVLTGPPAAAGVVRQRTATYSAVDTTTGVVTITALGTNLVQQIDLNVASTAGNLKLNVQKTDGTFVTTANIAWSATDATYLASINSALDTATGVVGGIVASAIPATDTDLGFRLTYSGTGYAGLAWEMAEVALFPTSSTAAYYTVATAPVDGRFIAGALIGQADGTQIPMTLIPDSSGEAIPANGEDIPFSRVPVAMNVNDSQLIPWPADTSLRQWIRDQLRAKGDFKFMEQY
jgi:hypothetical protein